jgi:NitT/TauT family transport system permease protein
MSAFSRQSFSLKLTEQMRAARYPLGAMLVALAIWETGVRLFRVPRFILPPPTTIVTEGLHYSASITPHFWITLYEASVGLAAAILIAIPLGLIFSYSAYTEAYPLLVLRRGSRLLSLLLVTWFGFGPI